MNWHIRYSFCMPIFCAYIFLVGCDELESYMSKHAENRHLDFEPTLSEHMRKHDLSIDDLRFMETTLGTFEFIYYLDQNHKHYIWLSLSRQGVPLGELMEDRDALLASRIRNIWIHRKSPREVVNKKWQK